MDGFIEKADRSGDGFVCLENLFPQLRAIVGQAEDMSEFIDVELIPRDFFQLRNKTFDLLFDAREMVFGYFADVPVCGYAEGRDIQLLGIPRKPILNVTALVGVVDQDIR